MPDAGLNGEQIKTTLKEYYDNFTQCGFEAFVVKRGSPKLKRMSLSEDANEQGKNFRTILKELFFDILKEKFLAEDCEYADGCQLANNQNKYLVFEQGDSFHPFTYVSELSEIGEFKAEDLADALGLIFCVRKGKESFWMYQHLWSIMVPNKKRTNPMARLMRFEDQIVFAEQRENLLTIAKKIDILVIDHYLITSNITLLQRYFGFQDYIYQSAEQTARCIVQKKLVKNPKKLTEYIRRGKSRYAKK